MGTFIKNYIKYCNTPVDRDDKLGPVFTKGLARSLPIGFFIVLFAAGILFANGLAWLALGLGTLFLIYLLGLV